MNKALRLIANFALLLCVLFVIRGIETMPWPAALPWQGKAAIVRYLGYVTVVAGLVIVLSRWSRQNALVVGGALGAVLAVLAGAFWSLIVATLFFFASYFIGRWTLRTLVADGAEPHAASCLLVGTGIYGSAVGLLAHFPVNFPGVYGVGLLFPVLLSGKENANLAASLWRRVQRKEEVGHLGRWLDLGLAVIALVYLAVALLPEVGYDPLAMHLFIPAQLLQRHQWGFDASTYVWAVMPMLADWIFSIGYILGGEPAARLVNLGFVFILASLARDLALWAGGAANAGRIAALLLLTTPLAFTQGSTLHVEGVWTAFLACATLAILGLTTSDQGREQRLVTGGALLGFALATKAITLLMLPLLAGVLLWKWRSWMRQEVLWPVIVGLASLTVIGSIPYVDAWRLTGNPVFPFFNQVFQSPLFPMENFRDMRWTMGVTWDILYAITFHSDRYQEAMSGAPGFQWLLLLVPATLLLIADKSWRGLLLLLLGALFVVLVFRSASYLRYVFPSVVIFSAALAVAVERGALAGGRLTKVPLIGVLAVTLSLNFLFLNAASWYGDFQLRPLFDPRAREDYVIARLPERAAVELVNRLNKSANPVAFLSSPFAAGLSADALYANWYNMGFRNALFGVKSDSDALNLLTDKTIDFVILNREWRGDGGNYEMQRLHIQNVTTEVATFGAISVRQINPDLRFQQEVLKNPDFRSKEGWEFSPGARWDPSSSSVLVSESAPVTQAVSVRPGHQYRNVVAARCAARPATGRLQINWHDAKGAFLKADGITFECSSDWTEHEMTVVAPPTTVTAVVYTAGHTVEPVAYRRNSLLR